MNVSDDICLLPKIKRVLFLILIVLMRLCNVQAQETVSTNASQQKDIGDLMQKVFKKKVEPTKATKAPGLAILPSVGYNPSLGFVLGAKASAGKQFGNPDSTDYSIFGAEALFTSKGIITLQVRHNVFTAGNKLNWQGNWQLSKFGLVDYGIGTGKGGYSSKGIVVNEFPTENSDSSFPIKYNYIRLFEKLYYKIGQHLYAGGGVSFNLHSSIKDEKQTDSFNTPHQRYSLKNGFSPKKYSTNGLIIALQYNTREHPIRSYGGACADVSLQFNRRWIGSTKNSAQLFYDFKKYWSLSKRHPEHVLAVWYWGSIRLSGKLPYLALTATGSDTYARSGRAYTIGRFKGPSYSCFETEYRFPILTNGLISGVCFFNLQSASDGAGSKLLEAWETAGGAGLRILLQKESRTTLCIDFAKGRYGSQGIFFGLNEVF